MGAVFRWIREMYEGRRLLGQSVARATATIALGTTNLFTVTGGRIIVTLILGELTIAMGAGATNIRLQADPTTGTTRNMCANLNVASYALGDLLGITGVNTDAMIPPATGGALEAQTMGVIVQEGTIDLVSDAVNAGSVAWTLKYIPIDAGAVVTAA
jgi:hypothetical protein